MNILFFEPSLINLTKSTFYLNNYTKRVSVEDHLAAYGKILTGCGLQARQSEIEDWRRAAQIPSDRQTDRQSYLCCFLPADADAEAEAWDERG